MILDQTVAVDVAVAVDPLQRPFRVRQQLAYQPVVAGPAPALVEQYQPERGGVDRPVVRYVRDLAGPRQLAAPQLVHDLARLLLGGRVLALALVAGEVAQGVARDPRVDGERLQRGDD